MRIEHVGLWAQDPECLKSFYERYFGACAGAEYRNERKQFSSYFLRFADGARLEIMHRPALCAAPADATIGYAHLAFAVGDEPQVDALTERLRGDGYRVVDGPRRTGDGYYESVVLDPEGNRIEITAYGSPDLPVRGDA